MYASLPSPSVRPLFFSKLIEKDKQGHRITFLHNNANIRRLEMQKFSCSFSIVTLFAINKRLLLFCV